MKYKGLKIFEIFWKNNHQPLLFIPAITCDLTFYHSPAFSGKAMKVKSEGDMKYVSQHYRQNVLRIKRKLHMVYGYDGDL